MMDAIRKGIRLIFQSKLKLALMLLSAVVFLILLFPFEHTQIIAPQDFREPARHALLLGL